MNARCGWFFFISVILATVPRTPGASLIAEWEFKNNYDDSVGSLNLTARGSPQFVTGPSGSAVYFGGGIETAPAATPLDALDLPATSAPNPTIFNSGFSLMGWMRQHQSVQGDLNIPGGSGVMIAQSGWFNPNEGWALSVNVNGVLDFALRDANDLRNISDTVLTVPENVWTQFAVTWDGSSADGFVWYLNGVAVAHTSIQVGVFAGFPNTPIQLELGATPNSAPPGALEHGYAGALADISVWGGVLTPSQVEANFLASVPEGGPGALILLACFSLFVARIWLYPRSAQ